MKPKIDAADGHNRLSSDIMTFWVLYDCLHHTQHHNMHPICVHTVLQRRKDRIASCLSAEHMTEARWIGKELMAAWVIGPWPGVWLIKHSSTWHPKLHCTGTLRSFFNTIWSSHEELSCNFDHKNSWQNFTVVLLLLISPWFPTEVHWWHWFPQC